jgi:hypothetical protein
MNGWTREQENLMAGWADIASCYRWMHDRCEKRYSGFNMSLSIPVIILSTLTGTANFAIDSFVPAGDDGLKKYVQAGIGGISIFAGILTTLGNFLRFAQLSEAHRVASISWGKLQRQIAVELRIHPNDRLDCLDFLKISRAELDRLIEQSPAIPDKVIKEFEKEFQDLKSLVRPDIAHGMDHTQVFHDRESVMKKFFADTAIVLKTKKKMLRDEILPDLDKRITDALEPRLHDIVSKRMVSLEGIIEKKVSEASQQARIAAESTAITVLEEAKKEEEAASHARLRIRAPVGRKASIIALSVRDIRKSVMMPPISASEPVSAGAPTEVVAGDMVPLSPRHEEIGSLAASAFRIVQPPGQPPSFEISFATPIEGSPAVDGAGAVVVTEGKIENTEQKEENSTA